MSILQTINLKKYYGTKPNITRALDGVNFTVEQGEFVAVVGTSGSGKSTLLHMMGGLDNPTSGSVIVRGEELAKKNDEELTIFRRRNIGFIFQNYNLVPILNVYENIVLPVELDGETVCLLSKLNAKQHIEVDIHMDELDLTDAEKKATYSEIKEYVLEHTGLKVSSLYIAQVKQKCGIIERENYNKPKSDDAKQPQCPPDKEKAIKEALKHFGMI